MHKFTAHRQWLRPTVYKYTAHCQWLRPKSCINTQPIVIGSDKKYIIIIMPLIMHKFTAHRQWLRPTVYNYTAHCHWLRHKVYNNYYVLIMHKFTAHRQWLRPKSCINTQPIVIGSDKSI